MGFGFYREKEVKMAKYHPFIKFVAKKKTVSELNGDLPLFLVLELTKPEFPIFCSTVAHLTWHLGI